MAVVFGVPLLDPPGMMPSGQMWEVGERRQRLPPGKLKSAPQTDQSAAVERVPGLSDSGQRSQAGGPALRGQKALQLWARPCNGPASPRQLETAHRAGSGGPLKVWEKFQAAGFAGKALAIGRAEAHRLA